VRPRPFALPDPAAEPPPRLWIVAPAVLLVNAAFLFGSADLWTALVLSNAVLAVLGFFAGRPRFRFNPFNLSIGALSAAALYGASSLALSFDAIAAPAAALFQWKGDHPPSYLLATIVIAVLGEELFWRGTAVPIDRRPVRAVLLGALCFAAAHIASGSWLLVAAALGMGVAWGSLYVLTRDLTAPLVCHLLWDSWVLFGVG
jgi:membrane protease YdiL (CAAX protease family)